jgi:hypothetical protein
MDESSSAFGQFIHDETACVMFSADIDMVTYANGSKIMRVIEHKHVGRRLSGGQDTMLKILAQAIRVLIDVGQLGPQSGVFMIESNPPFEEAFITQIQRLPHVRYRNNPPRYKVDKQTLIDFIQCKIIGNWRDPFPPIEDTSISY